MKIKAIIVACATAFLSVVGQEAEAQTGAAAQVLFDEAMTLMDAGKHTEACPKLDESLRLDPAMGTRFQLAVCYESIGKITSAWSNFIAVADEANRLKDKAREDFARKRATALAARLPKLTIEVPPAVVALPGLEIRQGSTVIGMPLWGKSFPVDPGEHVISVKAEHKRAWEQTTRVAEGASLTVKIPLLEDVPQDATKAVEKDSGPRPTGATPERDKSSGSGLTGQRAAALAVGGVGVAGLIVGSIFGVRAFLQWDSALSHCQGGDRTRCDDEGMRLGDSASTSGTVSSVMFAVGGAGVAASVILWVTGGPPNARDESAVEILPSVGADHVSSAVRMRF